MATLAGTAAAPPAVRLLAVDIPRRAGNTRRSPNPGFPFSVGEFLTLRLSSRRWRRWETVASHLCERDNVTISVDWNELEIREAASEEELLSAVRLRVRTFYEFSESCGIEDHKRYLTEREFEALKDRVFGRRGEFKRVSCINATLPLSPSISSASDLCSACKFPKDGKDRIVVGTLDLNQCLKLADELTGKKPESGGNLTRAYLSNVCVAKELQRNGLGYQIVAKSKKLAHKWGVTDLYVHVAVDNEAAQILYQKSGFVYEDEEPAWHARFLGRPRRFLLWADLTQSDS